MDPLAEFFVRHCRRLWNDLMLLQLLLVAIGHELACRWPR